jgi:ribulose-phosphate 3-epimerase
MVEVIPAILPENIEEIREKMSLVNGLVNIVQVDVCDGKFVSNTTWPYKNDNEGSFEKIIGEEEGFPFWDSLDFEVDLMVKNPEEVVEEWINAGAKRLVLHVESSDNIYGLIKKLRDEYGYSGDNPFDIDIGLSLDVKTSNEAIYEFLNPQADGKSLINFVQFMGIDRVGFQGESFDETVLNKIKEMRNNFPSITISVDGGVNLNNAYEIVEAGANRLISGSAIFESGDVGKALEELGQA